MSLNLKLPKFSDYPTMLGFFFFEIEYLKTFEQQKKTDQCWTLNVLFYIFGCILFDFKHGFWQWTLLSGQFFD